MRRLPLADGDTGVQRIQSLTFSGTSGAVGNIAIVLLKRVAMISLPVANVAVTADFATLGLPRIEPDACLQMVMHAAPTASNAFVMGSLSVVAG